LLFLANEIKNNPAHIQMISSALFDRAKNLTRDVEIGLDAPLSDKDE
jgi:antitoxin PrlF